MVAVTWNIAEDLVLRERQARQIKESWWKTRIEREIKKAREVITNLERKKKKKRLEGMIKKWHILGKCIK